MTRIELNALMWKSCLSSKLLEGLALPEALANRLERTSFVSAEGCYFVSYLYEQRGNATRSRFPDETGYESFVNHFHYDAHGDCGGILPLLKFCALIEEKWRRCEFNVRQLRQIISRDGDSWVYGCHVARDGQSLLADDLDRYDQETIVIETTKEKGTA